MKIVGLISALILGSILIYFSNYLFLVCFLILPFLMSRIRQEYFKCPSCGYIQKKYIILDTKSYSIMTHGRTTKSGMSDKRYNTQYEDFVDIDYGVECQKCSRGFKTTRTYKE